MSQFHLGDVVRIKPSINFGESDRKFLIIEFGVFEKPAARAIEIKDNDLLADDLWLWQDCIELIEQKEFNDGLENWI